MLKERQCFLPGQLWLDNNGNHINAHGGGILFHSGIYYWYGEHKVEGERGNKAYVGVHCYSSIDLYNWIDEGVALSVVDDDEDHPLAAGCIVERPKVIYCPTTGRFVMWFHHELKDKGYSSACSGLAVADSPVGPFRYQHSLRPNAGFWPVNVLDCHKRPVSPQVRDAYYMGGGLPEHPDELNLLGKAFPDGQMARDMTLFVDDDGTAYHIYSSEYNSTLHIAELTTDYQSHTGRYVRAFVARWMEAPALFKHNGKYHLIASGCTGWAPNTARHAVANSLFGPWMELGNPCEGEDAHLTFGGQSTCVLPVANRSSAFIFMADIWRPQNAIDGRYAWLPIEFLNCDDGAPRIRISWHDEWDLTLFG